MYLKNHLIRYVIFLSELPGVIATCLKENKTKILNHYKQTKIKYQALGTPSIITNPSSKIQVSLTTSYADYPLAILAVKSLFLLSQKKLSVMIVDDGTLRKKDISNIKKHLIKARVVKDKLIEKRVKKKFGEKSEIFKNINLPYIRKKVVPWLFSNKEKVLFLDSDILFFQRPREVIEWMEDKFDSFYIQDFQDSYFLSNIECLNYFKVRPAPKVNSGLLGIRKSEMDMQLLERLIKLHRSLSVYRPLQFQVFFAILFSLNKRSKVLKLPKSYLVSLEGSYKTSKLIARHYVRPVRHKIYKDISYLLGNINKRTVNNK